jgi:hypothetical protein
MQLVITIIILAFCAGAYVYVKKTDDKRNAEVDHKAISEKTAQEFINAKDVSDNCLYTLDGVKFAFVKIDGLCLELYSESELLSICKSLSADLSKFRSEFKYVSVSRPIDISRNLQYYSDLYSSAESDRRKALRWEMEDLTMMATSGETLERQHYVILWSGKKEHENDLIKRTAELAKIFNDNNVTAAPVQKKGGIVMLCNLIFNPAYVQLEDHSDIDSLITALKEKTS